MKKKEGSEPPGTRALLFLCLLLVLSVKPSGLLDSIRRSYILLRISWLSRQSLKKAEPPESAAEPPRRARLLACYLPKEYREFVLGDLDELFLQIAEVHGEREARRRYWFGVVASLWPLIFRELEKWTSLIGKSKIK